MPQKPLLIVGHPGHELRVFGWMLAVKPEVIVLTAGGGASREGRVESTRHVLDAADATPGPLFGNFSDVEIYQFILNGEAEPLAEWTRTLAGHIAAMAPEIVAGDMIEGYNPSHDICRYLINAALELADRSQSTNWSFPLIGRPDQAWNGALKPIDTRVLSDGELAKKCDAALGYPELAQEVEGVIAQVGRDAFRLECFYETPRGSLLANGLPENPPFYETYGEKQVAAGKYKDVIRFESHVAPLVRAIRKGLNLPVD